MVEPLNDQEIHRRLGAELNNMLWGEIDAGRLTPELDDLTRDELLYAAHASTYHWIRAGTVANRARGEHLISRVAVALGFYEEALHHARRCLELVTEQTGEMEDWDLAFAHEALSRSLAAVGSTEEAAAHRRSAIESTALVKEDEDRVVLEIELARPPWFGL